MNRIVILSDGTAIGTHVYAGNTKLEGIAEIRINPIVPMGNVTAQITFSNFDLNIVADIEEQ